MAVYDDSFFDKDSAKDIGVTLDNIVSLKECIVDITVHAISEFSTRKISEDDLEERLSAFLSAEEVMDEEEDSIALGLDDQGQYEIEVDEVSFADKAKAIRATREQGRPLAHQMLQEWILVDGSDADIPIFASEDLAPSLCNNLFMELFVLPEPFVHLVTKNMYSIANGLNYVAHELIYLLKLKYGSEDAIMAAGIDYGALTECAKHLNDFDETSTSDISSLDISALCFDAAEYLDCTASSLKVLGNSALILKRAQ